MTFMDRKSVLGAIYGQIEDKSKILLNKSISKVDQNEDGVTVYCEDGTEYQGDVLAGCDGVNSKVRSEMWRIADEEKPGAIPKADKNALFSDYRCLFGICDKVEGTELGGMDSCFYKDYCFLLIVGKDYRTYFFLTQKYPKRYQYGEIPRRSTQVEADEFAEANLDRKIYENLTFRNFWEKRKHAAMVPIEEGDFKIWSWGRLVCVGDSIHKMTPHAGQGANAAIESAAALANQLYRMKQDAGGNPPSFDQIRKGFKAYQKKRTARVVTISAASNDLTRLQALRNTGKYLTARFVLPYMGDFLTDLICDANVGAEILEYLPPPPRSLKCTMPFNPEQGTGNSESRLLRALIALPLLGFAALAVRGMDMKAAVPEIFEISKKGRFEANGLSVPLRSSLYHVDLIDEGMNFLTALFAQITLGSDPITYWQALTFITDFTGMYAVFLVESSRRVNNLTFMQM
jgi:2-polyprenyl-6-methoxyphenol hydroxylase-like FAD-dependent oxidoreductase